ncbi:hypothetical protein BDW72DRAFT_115775 [Aspergillus terricola var. indicus]
MQGPVFKTGIKRNYLIYITLDTRRNIRSVLLICVSTISTTEHVVAVEKDDDGERAWMEQISSEHWRRQKVSHGNRRQAQCSMSSRPALLRLITLPNGCVASPQSLLNAPVDYPSLFFSSLLLLLLLLLLPHCTHCSIASPSAPQPIFIGI